MPFRSGLVAWRRWSGQALDERDKRRDGREVSLLLLAVAFVFSNAIAFSLLRESAVTWAHLYAPACWLAVVVIAHLIIRTFRPGRDPFLLPVFALLAGWGLLLQDRLAPNFLGRQTLWFTLATAAMLIIAVAPRTLQPLMRYRYVLVLGGLVVGSLLRNGDKVVSNSGDRVVAQRPDGTYYLLKDDDAALRQPGSEVRTESFEDGSTRTTVTQADGTRIVTIRNAAGRVLRRDRILPDGREVRLLDDTAPAPEIDVSRLPSTQGRVIGSEQDLAEALAALEAGRARGDLVGGFSLGQIRDIDRVRHLAPRMEVDNIVFASGSSAIRSSEAEKLDRLGRLMQDMVAQNPREIFLIEGHTDAVGGADYNLALSDRRAESLALALSEYFDIPAENMVVQGYGESELRVDTIMDEPRNRRAVVRVITPLMREAAAQ